MAWPIFSLVMSVPTYKALISSLLRSFGSLSKSALSPTIQVLSSCTNALPGQLILFLWFSLPEDTLLLEYER